MKNLTPIEMPQVISIWILDALQIANKSYTAQQLAELACFGQNDPTDVGYLSRQVYTTVEDLKEAGMIQELADGNLIFA